MAGWRHRAGNAERRKTVIKNVGMMLSGARVEKPILDADTLITIDGKIDRSLFWSGKGPRYRSGRHHHRCPRHNIVHRAD